MVVSSKMGWHDIELITFPKSRSIQRWTFLKYALTQIQKPRGRGFKTQQAIILASKHGTKLQPGWSAAQT